MGATGSVPRRAVPGAHDPKAARHDAAEIITMDERERGALPNGELAVMPYPPPRPGDGKGVNPRHRASPEPHQGSPRRISAPQSPVPGCGDAAFGSPAHSNGSAGSQHPDVSDAMLWDHNRIDAADNHTLRAALKHMQLEFFKAHREAFELRSKLQVAGAAHPISGCSSGLGMGMGMHDPNGPPVPSLELRRRSLRMSPEGESSVVTAQSFDDGLSFVSGAAPSRQTSQVSFTRTSGILRRAPSSRSAAQRRASSIISGDDAASVEADDASALCHYASIGAVEALQDVLNQGVSPDTADYDKRTALHLAAEEGHLFCVQLLLDFGANVNIRDRWGATPLRGALTNVHNDVANLLKEHGAMLMSACDSPVAHRGGGTRSRHERTNQSYVYALEKFCNLPSGVLIPITGLACFYLHKYGVDITRTEMVFDEMVMFTEEVVQDEHTVLKDWYGETPPHCLPDTVKAEYPRLFAKLEASGNLERAMRSGGIGLRDTAGVNAGKNAGKPYMQSIMARLSLGATAIGNWSSFVRTLTEVCQSVIEGPDDGELNPLFADETDGTFTVSVCTVEGQTFTFGEDKSAPMHSLAKIISYAAAIELHGEQYVHNLVGRNSSGRPYDDVGSAVCEQTGMPYNAATNAGALVVCSTYHPHLPVPDRVARLRAKLSEGIGGEDVAFDDVNFEKEANTASYKNRAIAHLLSARECYPPHVKTHADLDQLVEFYLRSCSLSCTGAQLAHLAATFANWGTCPTTNKKCFSWTSARSVLSLCFGCGLWQNSGAWAAGVGMPAISSISGALLIVVPGVLGMVVRSPKLDAAHNSVRGQAFAQKFAEKFHWGVMDLAFRAKDVNAMSAG